MPELGPFQRVSMSLLLIMLLGCFGTQVSADTPHDAALPIRLLPIEGEGEGDDEVVVFPDPNLEAAIRAAISKPAGDIYDTDLLGLTVFNAYVQNIQNLTGLEYAVNLNYLSLGGNTITDLAPLAGLIHLEYLSLPFNQISDLGPLAGLINLRMLSLAFNQISDITPLAGLSAVLELYLSGNQISSIAPLTGMTSLRWLYMSSNQVSDLSSLTELDSLIEIVANANQVSDLSPLAPLTGLIVLSLSNNQITDIGPITTLANISDLVLSSNQISDLSPLSGMLDIEYCYLDFNLITDIGPLLSNAGLAEGDTLDLSGNPLGQNALCNGIPALQARGVEVISDSACSEQHSADQNADNKISLSELLRVIQCYNSGGYHCADPPDSTEDGYVAGPGGNHACAPHASDYNPQDWQVSLSELLRLIQFYNFGGYHACPGEGAEDGYCPGVPE